MQQVIEGLDPESAQQLLRKLCEVTDSTSKTGNSSKKKKKQKKKTTIRAAATRRARAAEVAQAGEAES